MSRQIQMRRGTAAQHNNFTGAPGEITVDTTNNTIRVHDGTTVGGTELARAKDIPEIPHMPTAADMARAAMPGNGYKDFILGISGATYTAPADGYFQLSKVAGVINGFIIMENTTNGLRADALGSQTYQTLSATLPASAGQEIRITHTATGNTVFFRFVYTNS